MAQDETYQVINYRERGGNNWVIGSGGTHTIERNGSIVVASGAAMQLQSGATFSIGSATTLGVAGEDVTGLDLRQLLVSNQAVVEINPSAGAASLSIQNENLPANAKIVTIYGGSVVSGSFWLTSVSAGRDVYLYLRGDSTGTFTHASTQIDVSTSGCILLGSVGTAISGFEMHTSIASDCGVHLVAVLDNVWAIHSEFGDIDG